MRKDVTTVTKFIILFLAFFAPKLYAQNLVTNSGFEDYTKEGIIGWETTAWSPDFYNQTTKEKTYKDTHCGTPIGKGFLGIMLCGEVTSTKLIAKLETNQDYLIKIFVQKPITFCPGGVKKITVAFSGGTLPHKEGPKPSFYPIPFINLYADNFMPLKEKCKWVEFSAIYKAKGTETYFHIGDFRNTKEKTSTPPLSEILYVDSLESSQCTYIHYDSVVVEKIPIDKEKPIVIEGVLFETNKSNLLPASYAALDNLFGLIYRLKNYKIKIVGHTDNVGNKTENLALSKSRADAVINYLVKKGIPKTKLSSSGQGDNKPIADNSTEQGRAKNRRVEIEIEK